MAEINTDDGGGGKKKHGKKRAKKSSTRIDMTPMVDLGFLLLTFFILTTTFNKPQAMQLTMPKKIKDPSELENSNKVAADHTLNVLLTKNNTVYYYFGMADPSKGALPALNKVSFGPNGLRKVLIDENNKRHNAYNEVEKLKKEVAEGKLPKDSLGKKKIEFFSTPGKKASFLTVLIKPDKEAKYKNVVDALDEMAICNIGIYALLESNPIEDQMIANATTYQ
jgi:biopolymer transport protein ExbD